MAAIKLILAIPVAIIAIAWAFGAVWFDAPFGAGNRLAAVLLAITFVVVLLFVRPFWRKLGIFSRALCRRADLVADARSHER